MSDARYNLTFVFNNFNISLKISNSKGFDNYHGNHFLIVSC